MKMESEIMRRESRDAGSREDGGATRVQLVACDLRAPYKSYWAGAKEAEHRDAANTVQM